MRPWEFIGLGHEVAERLPRSSGGKLGAVYAIEISPGTVKVGFSTDPRGRLRAIINHQRIYGHDSIGRVAVSRMHSDARATEASVLAAFRERRLGGELLAATIDEVGAVVASLNLRVSPKASAEDAAREQRATETRRALRAFAESFRSIAADIVDHYGLADVARLLGVKPHVLRSAVTPGGRVSPRAQWMAPLAVIDPSGPRISEAIVASARAMPGGNTDSADVLAGGLRERNAAFRREQLARAAREDGIL